MPRIYDLLEAIEEVAEHDLQRVDAWLRRHRHEHYFIPRAGRFAGMFHVDLATGEYTVATQQLTVGVAFTAALIFTDTATGATGPGPIGVITASDPSVTVSLSADGQFANATMTQTLPTPGTITWHDPASNVPDFTVQVTDAAVVSSTLTGAFSTFNPGTSA